MSHCLSCCHYRPYTTFSIYRFSPPHSSTASSYFGRLTWPVILASTFLRFMGPSGWVWVLSAGGLTQQICTEFRINAIPWWIRIWAVPGLIVRTTICLRLSLTPRRPIQRQDRFKRARKSIESLGTCMQTRTTHNELCRTRDSWSGKLH